MNNFINTSFIQNSCLWYGNGHNSRPFLVCCVHHSTHLVLAIWSATHGYFQCTWLNSLKDFRYVYPGVHRGSEFRFYLVALGREMGLRRLRIKSPFNKDSIKISHQFLIHVIFAFFCAELGVWLYRVGDDFKHANAGTSMFLKLDLILWLEICATLHFCTLKIKNVTVLYYSRICVHKKCHADLQSQVQQ